MTSKRLVESNDEQDQNEAGKCVDSISDGHSESELHRSAIQSYEVDPNTSSDDNDNDGPGHFGGRPGYKPKPLSPQPTLGLVGSKPKGKMAALADKELKELEYILDLSTRLTRPNSVKRESNQTAAGSPSLANRELTNKNNCFSYQKPINGQAITALGHLWHLDHLACYHCHTSIGADIFYEKDNRPFCEEDHLKLYSPKCASCTRPILSKMTTALNKTWHSFCFTCYSCATMLDGEFFLDNEKFCRNCFVKDRAPKCRRCNEGVAGEYVWALDGLFHSNCFDLTQCATPLDSPVTSKNTL